jgi:hypothetical protein
MAYTKIKTANPGTQNDEPTYAKSNKSKTNTNIGFSNAFFICRIWLVMSYTPDICTGVPSL